MNQFKLDVSSSDTYYTVTWFDSLAGIAVILMTNVD
jgi:predicted transcriptional regulator